MSDYEIRDVMHRSNSAIIEVSFLISKEIQHIVPDDFRINVTGRPRKSARTETKVWLELHALNSGSVFAEFVAGHITLPPEIMDEFWRRDIETDDNGDITLRFDNSERIRHGIQTVGEKRIPLLPGMQENLGRFSLNPAIEHFGQRAIKWRVFTEKSAPRQGKILMSNISISTKEGRFSEDSLGQKKRIT
ncbi:hypothetical protein [Deinococcus cavernae]|uniref:hypothetical protein n=1 Tax=Deinococcus cavernae TaxID=2320857 RepID=UPI0011C2270A|nr:hypothetical protein [Deinococcus cavernae]